MANASFNLTDLNGSNGCALNGIGGGGFGIGDLSGRSVQRAGDINGDGIGDIIIGAPLAGRGASAHAGQSYVIFGSRNGFVPSLNLSSLDGRNGFAINGVNQSDQSGTSVSGAGDVNGDGVADLLIGAYSADANGKRAPGQSYVIYGSRSGFSASFNLGSLNGSNGFVINGIASGDDAGQAVSGAGDINGDGIADLIIGADQASPNRNMNAGQSYVIFGVRSGNIQPIVNPSDPAQLLWRNNTSGQNAVWQLHTFTLQSSSYLPTVADVNWRIITTADFNRDGTPDLLWRNQATGENTIWQMNSTGFQSGYSLPAVSDTHWQIAGITDLGGDSTPDILWRNDSAGKTVIWQLSGFSFLQAYSLPDITSGWSVKPFASV